MRTFIKTRRVTFGPRLGLVLGLVFLLAGCNSTPGWGSWSVHPSPAQIAAVLGRMDNCVYFPGYEIYFNRTKGQYVFSNGQAWITQKEPLNPKMVIPEVY